MGRFGESVLGLLVLVSLCSTVQGLVCYHTDSPIAITTQVLDDEDCVQTFGLTQGYEDELNLLRSDQEYLAELPTCAVVCEGETRDSAVCSYSCMRFAACEMLEVQGDRLQNEANKNTDTELFFEECQLRPELCVPRYFMHKCCAIQSHCNTVPAAGSRGELVTY